MFTTGLLVLFFTKDYLGAKLWKLSTIYFPRLDTLEISVNILSIYAFQGAMFFITAVFPVLIGIVLICFNSWIWSSWI